MQKDIIKNAIAANIAALGELIEQIAESVGQAEHAMVDGEQNQAIGGLLSIDQQLEEALALYRACIALHRAGGPS